MYPDQQVHVETQGGDDRKERISAPIMLVLCSVLALVLSQVIQVGVPPEVRLVPLLVIPLALALFIFGIWSVERGHLPVWLGKVFDSCAAWLRIQPNQLVSLVNSLFFSVLTCTAAGFSYQMRMPIAAILCWLIGIGLVLYGGWNEQTKGGKISKSVVIGVVVTFSVSLAIRSFNTATIPIVLSGDEASSGLFSIKYITGEVNNLFITGWFSFPVLHNFLQSLSIRIFGQTTQALRLLAALGGALTVVLVYLMGRKMFGNLAGWAAAIFLAGMHFHNHFSRIGLNNIWDGFFFTLVLGCLWIAWRRNSRAFWLLAGVCLGLAQYFYATGRLLFGIIPLWLLVAGICDWRRLKKSIPDLVLMGWVAIIVLLPLGWFYINHFDEFLAPMNRVTIFGEWLNNTASEKGLSPILVFLEQIKLGLLGYIGEPTRMWYMPGVPLLRAIPGAVFLLGMAFTLVHPKDDRSQLLWIWLGAIAFAVASSDSAPAAQRYVAAAPALALMVGFGLGQLGNLIIKWLPKKSVIIQTAIILVSVLLAVDDARFYYLEYTPKSDFSGFNGMVAQRLANRLKNEPKGTDLYFTGYPVMGYDSISSLPYIDPQLNYINVDEPWNNLDLPVPQSETSYFAFLPEHESDMAAMEMEYPDGTWSEEKNTKGQTLYWLYEINGK